MKIRTHIWLICLLMFTALQVKASGIDKEHFYNTLRTNNLQSINSLIDKLDGYNFTEREGYEGALLMRKASLLKNAKEKINTFNKGKIKLENAINKHKNNLELRFIRFLIQENTPRIVKYYQNMPEDRSFIKNNFKNYSPTLQSIIKDYSKASKTLKL